MTRTASAWLLILMVAACSPVTGGSASKEDPGPFPENYEQLVQSYLSNALKDPSSLQELSIQRPIQNVLWLGLVGGGNVQLWTSCVSYNAKNSFGGYVGRRSYTFPMKFGQIFIDATGSPRILDGCQ